jgi:drug/metabolite transporter (DMT)-like permease
MRADVGPRRRPLVGAGLLFGAAVVWGFAFVPQKHTVLELPPLTATALRFCLAAPLAILLANHRLLSALRPARPPGPRQGSDGGSPRGGRQLRRALVLGVLLFLAYALQTAGLVQAPVVRVSLITGMYAVLVPLFAPFVGHARPGGAHWLGALLAFGGLLGLVGVIGDKDVLSVPLNMGDVYTLLHAAIGALQVLLVGKLARDADPYAVNAVQLTVVMLLAVPAALIFEGPPDLALLHGTTIAAFLYLALFSTVVAFLLQIVGQRHTSAPTAAVIMLLEVPIGVLAALVFLDERMGWSQWLGAFVLILGVCTSLWPELRSRAASAPP